MSTATGNVEVISKYNSIKLDTHPDIWFSCYRAEQLEGVNRGDNVSFEYVEKTKGTKTYFNVKGAVQVVEEGTSTGHIVTKPRAFSSGTPAFPVPALDRSRPIIRQNALSHATNVVMHCTAPGPLPLEMAKEIVEVARYFESYSDGSMDVEGVEEEAEDIISKLMAKKESKSGTETPA